MSQDSLCNSAWLHNSPVLGLALGILTTALFQSSSATTSLAPCLFLFVRLILAEVVKEFCFTFLF